MTNLRKCLGVTTFAVLALAFCCLIISQAAIANADRVDKAVNSDNSFESSVPLPTVPSRGGPSSSAQTNEFEYGSSLRAATEGGRIGDLRLTLASKNNPIRPSGGATKGRAEGCARAIDMPGVGPGMSLVTASGTTVGSADDFDWVVELWGYPPGSCSGFNLCQGDEWYQFTPSADVKIDISLCASSGDRNLTIFSGPDCLTYVTDSDDACGAQPEILALTVSGGVTYTLIVDGWDDDAFTIDITEYVPHPDVATAFCAQPGVQHESDNELCGERLNGGCYGNYPLTIEAPGTAEVIAGDFRAALICGTLDINPYIQYPEVDEGIRSGIERDADQWYFEVTEPTKLVFTIYSEIDCYVFMPQYTDRTSCENNGNVGAWPVGKASTVTETVLLFPGWHAFSIRANTEVLSCSEGDYGEPRYYIETDFVPLIPIDDCPVALEAAGDYPAGSELVIDLDGMTPDGIFYHAPTDGYYYNPENAWVAWTCEESGDYTFNTFASPCPADLVLAAYFSACPADPDLQVAWNDDAEGGVAPECWRSEISFIAAAGFTYMISVGDNNPYWGDPPSVAYIEITHTPLPLLGDDCDVDPIIVTADVWQGFSNNLNADRDGPVNSLCNQEQFGGDIWFELTAWADGYVTADFIQLNYDVNMEVYAGAECPTDANLRDPILCNDDGADPDNNPYGTGDWPYPSHGSWGSWPCSIGDVFLIRLGGWFDEPANPLHVGGMGFGFYDLYIDADGPGPDNDHCSDVTPELLTGLPIEFVGNTYWATYNDCWSLWPDYPQTVISAPVWEAFSVPADICMNVSIDYCATTTTNEDRYIAGVGKIWTGCPCDGDFVLITHTTYTYSGEDCTRNTAYTFDGLATGTYYIETGFPMHRLAGPWDDYVMTVAGIPSECIYCEATNTIGGQPPIGGTNWIIDVTLGNLAKVGIPTVKDPIGVPLEHDWHTPNSDHTSDAVGDNPPQNTPMAAAQLYKGITYSMLVTMDKVGSATGADSCDVYIDWDQSSSLYDAGERNRLTRSALNWTGDITVPVDAMELGQGASGETLMRVRLTSNVNGPAQPCGQMSFGEAEDFSIEVTTLECGDLVGELNGVDSEDIDAIVALYFTGDLSEVDFWQRADIDGDGVITMADVIALVNYLYHEGSAICI